MLFGGLVPVEKNRDLQIAPSGLLVVSSRRLVHVRFGHRKNYSLRVDRLALTGTKFKISLPPRYPIPIPAANDRKRKNKLLSKQQNAGWNLCCFCTLNQRSYLATYGFFRLFNRSDFLRHTSNPG